MAAAFKFAYNLSYKRLKMIQKVEILKQTELLGRRLTVYGTAQEPLFLAKDVADWLEHTNPSAMLKMIDDDEKRKVFCNLPNLNKDYKPCESSSYMGANYLFLTEDGLYEVIMQSNLPIAKQFKKGVKQILKEIRTTGGYIATQANETPEMIMARALKVAEYTIEEHEKRMKALAEENEAQKRINKQLEADTQMKAEEIKKLTPDADYARQTLTAVNTWNTNIIAKEMGMSAVTLNQHLQRLGIQYKQHKVWILSAKYQGKGYTKTQTYNYFNSAGEVCTRMQQEWTEVGRRWLLELWKQGKFSGSAV